MLLLWQISCGISWTQDLGTSYGNGDESRPQGIGQSWIRNLIAWSRLILNSQSEQNYLLVPSPSRNIFTRCRSMVMFNFVRCLAEDLRTCSANTPYCWEQ